MFDAFSPFAVYLGLCAEALALPQPVIEKYSYMFRVDDRWIELRYSPGDERVTFAALVYVAPADVALDATLVAQFNVTGLFSGGSSLVPGEEGLLYLCRPHRLASLDPRRIREDLSGFSQLADRAGTFYIAAIAADQSGLAPAPTDGTDGANLLKI